MSLLFVTYVLYLNLNFMDKYYISLKTNLKLEKLSMISLSRKTKLLSLSHLRTIFVRVGNEFLILIS